MEPNIPSTNDNVVDQQLPAEQNARPKSTLNIKFLLIAAIVFILVVLSVIFISVKSTTKNIVPATPTEAPKPTLRPFPPKGEYVENQLIVEYREGMSPEDLKDNNQRSQLAEALQDAGVVSQEKHYQSTDPKLKNFYILTFKEGIDAQEVSNKIYAIPQIKSVEPNGTVEIFK